MEQVHGIDNQCTVASIFSDGVPVLLNGVDAVIGKGFSPTSQVRRRKVAIDAPYCDPAVACDLFNDGDNGLFVDVVGIYQQSENWEFVFHRVGFNEIGMMIQAFCLKAIAELGR